MAGGRHIKVLKLHILKPAGDMSWKDLSTILRDTRYRVFRLANLAVSEAFLAFHHRRTGSKANGRGPSIGKLNRRLRGILDTETTLKKDCSTDSSRFSAEGALPATVTDALSQYKLRALLTKSKWNDVARGKSSLPTYRLNMSIPVRCDKPGYKRLVRNHGGDLEVELMVCRKPYPRVIIATARESISNGQRAILDRLLENEDNNLAGYRQRCFEVKQDRLSGKWHLFVTYDFPAKDSKLNAETIVGVDVGFACPLYAAVSNGFARLGWKHFAAAAKRIRSLQSRVINRRREILRGGNAITSSFSARSGHGRGRKLRPIDVLQGRIDRAYTTLNHQLSAAVIKFALDNSAGTIQMENLDGLKEELTGTFLGERWRYEELQRFIKYKAQQAGIEVKEVDPRFTSRRCSECGFIYKEFSRKFRDENKKDGKTLRFICPDCGYEADADYNAARNLGTRDIEKIIGDSIKD